MRMSTCYQNAYVRFWVWIQFCFNIRGDTRISHINAPKAIRWSCAIFFAQLPQIISQEFQYYSHFQYLFFVIYILTHIQAYSLLYSDIFLIPKLNFPLLKYSTHVLISRCRPWTVVHRKVRSSTCAKLFKRYFPTLTPQFEQSSTNRSSMKKLNRAGDHSYSYPKITDSVRLL